jgi:hypothetical protein
MLRTLRWAVIALGIAGLALCAISLSNGSSPPSLGANTVALGTQRPAPVGFVLPGSAAERAGIRTGDLLRFAAPSDAAALAAHLRTTVHLVRPNGAVINVELTPVPRPLVHTLLVVQGFLLSLLALLLALRAWQDIQARRLAIGFLWVGVGWSDVASGWAAMAVNAAGDILTGAGMAALVFFATGWRATPPSAALLLRAAAIVVAVVYVAAGIPGDLAIFNSRGLLATEQITWLLLAVLVIAGLAASTVRARGVERRRVGWLLVTMTIAFAPFAGYDLVAAVVPIGPPPTWVSVTTLVLPFGFGYAMLRHRVVDIGFALNRAAVFAATTALLVGLFGALQWSADQVLVRATGAQDFAVQMAIAVIVLYAVRKLRTKTDALVARVFFAKRRRRIDAIVALGYAVEAVESVLSLGPFVIEQLRADAAIDSSLYVETEDAYVRVAGDLGPERVGRDNATVILLRATRAPVAVRAESDLIGAIAFPLAVRGRLRGALVCGLPSEDEEFAPDEQSALNGLAARVCVVRDDLLAEQLQGERDELRRTLVRLTGGSGAPAVLATAPRAVE